MSLFARRFISTRVNNFDTFKFVERLEKEKFTRQQSEAIMSCLRKVITSSMTELTEPMVTKAEKEKVKINNQLAWFEILTCIVGHLYL